MSQQPKPEIINTYDQLQQWKSVGVQPVAIGPAYAPGSRTRNRIGWDVWHLLHRTDPDAAWYHYGRKVFSEFMAEGATAKDRRKAALEAAMQWCAEKYGVTEWARNRMGDYVPKQLNKLYPLPKDRK